MRFVDALLRFSEEARDMTRVAIFPVPSESGLVYCAVTGDKQSQGISAGAALDALTAQLPESETETLIVIQSGRPDQFFTAEQQRRLAELMDSWRSAQETGASGLSTEEQAELRALVDAELRASAERASLLADELER